ncbi:hypothetical protein C1H46_041053 [Malus baccata]|uniref:Uncharacterized protein n=1 Tax=Malus baccata TaxID=106549 RepID=A0A540KGX8_MALBA|nr:hypothetical protein C1H46_041053 [Malus baccata]
MLLHISTPIDIERTNFTHTYYGTACNAWPERSSVLVPTKKHRNANPSNIELPFLLPHHSFPLGKSPAHASHDQYL